MLAPYSSWPSMYSDRRLASDGVPEPTGGTYQDSGARSATGPGSGRTGPTSRRRRGRRTRGWVLVRPDDVADAGRDEVLGVDAGLVGGESAWAFSRSMRPVSRRSTTTPPVAEARSFRRVARAFFSARFPTIRSRSQTMTRLRESSWPSRRPGARRRDRVDDRGRADVRVGLDVDLERVVDVIGAVLAGDVDVEEARRSTRSRPGSAPGSCPRSGSSRSGCSGRRPRTRRRSRRRCSSGCRCRRGSRCSSGCRCSSGSRCTPGCRCSSGSRCSSGCRCRPGCRCSSGCRCTPGSRCSSGCRCTPGCRCSSGCRCTPDSRCSSDCRCTTGSRCRRGSRCSDGLPANCAVSLARVSAPPARPTAFGTSVNRNAVDSRRAGSAIRDR